MHLTVLFFRSRIFFGMRIELDRPSAITEGGETVVGYPDRPVVIKPIRFHHIVDFRAYMGRKSRAELHRRKVVSSRP